MAYEVGISRSHAFRLEKGEIEPKFNTLRVLAAYFGVKHSELVQEIEKEYERMKGAKRKKPPHNG